MTEIAELISSIIDMEDKHSEKTCPWHEEKKSDEGKLEEADIEEDVEELKKNNGGKLGDNLEKETGGSKRWPQNMKVSLEFSESGTIKVAVKERKKTVNKQLTLYESNDSCDYDVVFAAHHLIPGNAALKGDEIVQWLGGEDKISAGQNKNGQPSSKIIDSQFSGYNVNNQENGIWLPGPYALSTKKKWPSDDVLKKAKSKGTISNKTKTNCLDFKMAYAFAVIDGTDQACDQDGLSDKEKDYVGCQFHFNHREYSEFVQKCLKKVNEKIMGIMIPICPKAKPNNEGKYNVPYGIVNRLNTISRRIAPYLKGKPWSKYIYTDKSSLQYIEKKP